MNLNKLYNLTEKENIKIFDWHVQDSQGIYLNYDKINAIGLNYDEFGTYIDEKCTLAHELGHYYTGSIYPLFDNQDKILKDKCEYRANKYTINILIPYEDLIKAVKNGNTTNYELADYFEVKIDLIQFAINYYINKGLLKTNI